MILMEIGHKKIYSQKRQLGFLGENPKSLNQKKEQKKREKEKRKKRTRKRR